MYQGKVNEIMQRLQKERTELVINLIGTKQGKILDIGCRYGQLEKELKGKYDYHGIDYMKYNPSPKNLRIADLNKNPKLDYLNKSFDIVVATEVIEHLFFIDEIYSEIFRVLKDDGIAIISLPNDFQLDKRINYLMGKPHGMATHSFKAGHHYMFDLSSAREFLEQKFVVKDQVNMYASRGARFTPSFIKNFLSKHVPSLFSSSQMYKLSKK